MHCAGSQGATNEIYSLASGHDARVNKYIGCVVNGVRFHTKERNNHRITQNSGVIVPGEYDDEIIDFDGRLCSVIELTYIMGYRVIIFECEWFDTNPKKKIIQRDYHLTSINVSNTWFKNDPFVLATQASQVFYLDDYKAGTNWKVAMKVTQRHIWDVIEKDNIEDIVDGNNDEAYQEGESSDVQWVVQEGNLDAIQLVRTGANSNEEISAPAFDLNDEENDNFIYEISEEEDDTLEEYCSEGEESE